MAVHLTSITSTFFVSLLNRLGCKPPPPEGFDLINTVQPVTLVDSDISLPVIATTMLCDVPATTGEQAVPGAGVLLADTGALPAGNYNVLITVGLKAVAGGCDFIVERRNAANAANVWRQVRNLNVNGLAMFEQQFQARLSINERIRVETAVGGTSTVEANIWVQLVQ